MLRLHLQPSVRMLALPCNAATLVDAHARGEPLPALHDAPATDWLLWRRDGDVHWRRLDADETALLHAVTDGECFGQLCERASAFHPDDGPLRAASLLKRWLANDLARRRFNQVMAALLVLSVVPVIREILIPA